MRELTPIAELTALILNKLRNRLALENERDREDRHAKDTSERNGAQTKESGSSRFAYVG